MNIFSKYIAIFIFQVQIQSQNPLYKSLDSLFSVQKPFNICVHSQSNSSMFYWYIVNVISRQPHNFFTPSSVHHLLPPKFNTVSQCCSLSQNFYLQEKYARSMNLQVHYLYLLRTERDKCQISLIGSHSFPGKTKNVLNIFEDATTIPPTRQGYSRKVCYLCPTKINEGPQKLPVCRPSGALESQERNPADQSPQNVTL